MVSTVLVPVADLYAYFLVLENKEAESHKVLEIGPQCVNANLGAFPVSCTMLLSCQ